MTENKPRYSVAMNRLRLLAGAPSLREISQASGISHTSVGSMMNGKALGYWRNILPVVEALTDDPEKIEHVHSLWQSDRRDSFRVRLQPIEPPDDVWWLLLPVPLYDELVEFLKERGHELARTGKCHVAIETGEFDGQREVPDVPGMQAVADDVDAPGAGVLRERRLPGGDLEPEPDAGREPRPGELLHTADELAAGLSEAESLLRYALHLRMHGERAPGGGETWREFDRRCEMFLRRKE